MAGFRKGALGSPFSTEYQGNDGMDTGTAERGEAGPRVGAGVLGKRVTMDVERESAKTERSQKKRR